MSDNKKSDMTDRGFLILITVVSIFVGWLKYKTQIMRFYIHWRYVIAFVISAALILAYVKLRNKFISLFKYSDLENEILSPSESDPAFFAGFTNKGKKVYIKESSRRTHIQVVGSTNAGKTESVVLPCAIDDIKMGRGLVIVDGKSDSSLLDKLYAYAKKYHREQDVRILSLCNVDISSTFNPFEGGSVLEVVERVFNALNFENGYFRAVQYDALLHCLLLLEEAGIKATPYRVIECLTHEKQLSSLGKNSKDRMLQHWVNEFLSQKRDEREQKTSGLVVQLRAFAVGELATIFNSENSDINLDRALENNEIIYCQLPALKIPSVGKATGKLILQCLQSAVASRHLGSAKNKMLFSIYLDDFTEYLTESFVTLLNKSRSANVAIVLAHQALGDLKGLKVGMDNVILTNTNLKIFMRTNEPDSAEYFSKVMGTTQSAKVTERQKDGLMGATKTGDGSVREVEEFKFHPNIFKQELGTGEAVMVLPHAGGSFPVRMKFRKMPDLDRLQIPKLQKQKPVGMPVAFEEEAARHEASEMMGAVNKMLSTSDSSSKELV